MTSRWVWALLLGDAGSRALRRELGAASNGFVGTTLATGTFGDIDSNVDRGLGRRS